jgi:hypothetical protein
MPNSLQYPLERHRDLQRRWQRLLQQTATPIKRAPVNALIGSNATVSPDETSSVAYVVGNTMPPRDPNNDANEDDEEDEDAEGDEDLEPAVIREPDKDE